MLNIETFSQDFCEKFPEFVMYWKIHTYYSPDEFAEDLNKNSPLLWQNGMGQLSDYVASNYMSMTQDELTFLFGYIEKSLVASDELLGTCLATGFLEGIYNRVPNKLPSSIMALMGAESKSYCIALDKFWGTKTLGLYA